MKKKILITVLAIILISAVVIFIVVNNKKVYYEVSFDSNGGTVVENQTIEEGGIVTKPTDPKRDGYVFEGWYDGTIMYDFASEVVSNLSLTASWSKENSNNVKYTITFDTDGGSKVTKQEVKEGNTVLKPTNPTKDGYTFKEWQLDGKKYDFANEVTKDITLKAIWEKKETKTETNTNINTNTNTNSETKIVNKKYSVVFNSNGGSLVDSQNIGEGNKVSKPNNPTRNGYEFVSWQLNGKNYDFNSKVTGNITLVAKWNELTKYTVTFNSNGGTSYSNQSVYEGSTASNPGSPSKSGYVFISWQLDGNDYNFSSKVTRNITLTAKYRELGSFTVSFNSNGGTTYNNQTVTEGNKATNPGNPTKEGHTFNGWYNGNSVYDFNSVVSSNLNLTASWTQKTYTVIIGIVDNTSPARTLTVKENGTPITVSQIKYSDGTFLCNGNAMNVNKYAIEGETSFIVVLSGGMEVTATLN